MATERFDVTFDGPALLEHRMSVRDLAPALIALADAFQVAQAVANPEARLVNLEITATRESSFAVDLILNSNLIDQAIDYLSAGRYSTAIANGAGILGFVGSAIAGILWVKKRYFTSEDLPDGQVRITTADGDSIVLPALSVRLMQNAPFRRDVLRFITPLESEGVDTVAISGADGAPRITIRDTDLESFGEPDLGETVVSDNTIEQVVTVDSVPFKESLSWRFNDGSASISATMSDGQFRDRIRRREVQFGEGDKLRAEIRTVQTLDSAGTLSTRRSVERVIDHLPGPVQGNLFDQE
ncbi:MAG: hypothetical protein ACJA07_003305 [Rhodococcus sp. (in: high G+C Gram-positive bacteria)]|jgi:hypothetical protein